jgi:ankyrin repeat protein
MSRAQKKQFFNKHAARTKKLGEELARELTAPEISGAHIDVKKCLNLITAGADVTTGVAGRTPLMSTAIYGSTELIAALLKAGAPVDAVDKSGNTALSCAVFHGHYNAAILLVAAGADPRIKNVAGKNAAAMCADWSSAMKYLINTAVNYKNDNKKPGKLGILGTARSQQLNDLLTQFTIDDTDTKKIRGLLDERTDFLQQDCKQLTPLAKALAWGHDDHALDILRLAPHTVNITDCGGWTPLFWCIKINGNISPAMTKALLAAGADPTVCDNEGKTVLDVFPNLHPDVFIPLKQAIADRNEEFRQIIRKEGISSDRPVNKLPRIQIRKPPA